MSKTVDVVAGIGLERPLPRPVHGGHMAFVSTILVSKDAMWWVTRMFEGQFVLGARYPGIV